MSTEEEAVQKKIQVFSLVIKTKVVQNVNRMSEKQKDRLTDSQIDRQADRQTVRLTGQMDR